MATFLTDPRHAAARFAFHADPIAIEPFGNGHIHATFAVDCGPGPRYVLQSINTNIFRAIPEMMENIARVTRHIAERETPPRVPLTIVPTRDGTTHWHADDGSVWRAWGRVENTIAHDIVGSADIAFTAAQAFGRFQRILADLPPPRLHETIPHFHDTPRRFAVLETAIRENPMNRAVGCAEEIAFATARRPAAYTLLDLRDSGSARERVTHNDTKINNVLFDRDTGEARCVIDLDTVMPGLSLYDFGDMVRTATSPAAEDERDRSRVVFRLGHFAQLARGYLAEARDMLTEAEIRHMPEAGIVITLETGVRFLADHLAGDTYFRIQHPGQNLDRCRTQFALVAAMEHNLQAMRDAVADATRAS